MELLLSRDSAVRLEPPGPDAAALDNIFRAALRAPDHGRLRPWRFVVIPEERRQRFGDVLAASLQQRDPDVAPETLARERQKALRAPVIVVVAARLKRSEKIPELEQIVSAGAAAQNVMLAVHALGYGAMWRTGAPAYDPAVKQALGLEAADTIIGFIYIGTRAGGASPVSRPVPEDFVSVWRG
ncbi:MAG TPA: nitroreductase [Burkholderiales bacterium]|nr:nitroreductase [Burkholderiales bacterium]